MAGSPINSPRGYQSSLPQRITSWVAEWTRAVIIIAAWCVALGIALTIVFLVARLLMFAARYAQQALGLGG
jgi:hypothetical protein